MANKKTPGMPPGGQMLIYRDGALNLQVCLEGQTVWLPQRLMAELFQTTVANINQHLASIYEDGELRPEATIKKYLIVQPEGTRQVTRMVDHYNLDAILAVGYRVKSLRGTQFRIWATQRLHEYIVKGFTLDDERLKKVGESGYFDELLDRIRDIRSSERVFWRKVLDIYATSIDYDPRVEASQMFFQKVQNKMHWAVSGQTAAEIVHDRADSGERNMGLTSWVGAVPRKNDVAIAKNYLTEDELKALNLIVSAYLDFADLQALNRKPMHMADWISKLDDFLKLSGREILTHAGNISHEAAKSKAEAEYEKFRVARAALPQPVDQHFAEVMDDPTTSNFDKLVDESKQIEKQPPKPKRAKK